MVKINSKAEDNYQLLEVVGEIDASTSIELDNALKAAAELGTHILIDLSRLEYISSAGLGVFISYIQELKSKDIRLAMFGLQEKVLDVFRILGLQHLMSLSDTKEEAISILNG